MSQRTFIPREMPIMPAMCKTCPFSAEGDPQTRAGVLSRLFDASQVCHHPALSGRPETHLCRGARDFQLTLLYRMGWLPEPTDQAFAARSAQIAAELAAQRRLPGHAD